MKRFIRNNIKVFVAVVISAIIFGGIGVYAASQYFAKDITFTPTNENFKKENGEAITNVEDALNELYKKSNNLTNYNLYLNDNKVVDIKEPLIYVSNECTESLSCDLKCYSINGFINDKKIRNKLLNNNDFLKDIIDITKIVPKLSNDNDVLYGNKYSNDYTGYFAFDQNDNTRFASKSGGVENFIGYNFNKNISVYKVYWKNENLNENIKTYKIQYYDEIDDIWKDATEILTSNNVNNGGTNEIYLENGYISKKWRMYILSSTSPNYVNLSTLQFYGIEVN